MGTATTSSGPERHRVAGRGGIIVARIVLGIGLAWLSLAVTADQVLGRRSPDTAVQLGTGGAAARAALANREVQPGGATARLADARDLAVRALAREPVSVPAVRALGTAAALGGDLTRANRLFGYAEQLSRRDLTTQLWLIEEQVRRGDVRGALVHYDRALRTSRPARSILFPVLATAASDPDITASLSRIMARRVAWGPDFLAVMAETPDASPDALGRLLIAARLRPDMPGEMVPLGAALARLIAAGHYEQGYAAYRRAVGARAPEPVRDGGFEAAGVLPPFDWSLADETDLSASREPKQDGSGLELVLRATDGRSGDLARQLLLLAPGTYRLGVTASGAASDSVIRAAVVVACAGAGGGERLRLPLSATSRARLHGDFTIPAGCRAQWLTITAPSGLGADPVTVDDLRIDAPRR